MTCLPAREETPGDARAATPFEAAVRAHLRPIEGRPEYIEHTHHPQAYLDELVRVTAPGGCIVLDLPNRYYAFEQHSWVPLVHYLPAGLRDALIRRLMAPGWQWLTSDDLRYRLSASLGLRLPSADRLVAMVDAAPRCRPTVVADAYFHSYDGRRVRFAGRRAAHLLGPARRCTTFRLVLRRESPTPRHASIAT